MAMRKAVIVGGTGQIGRASARLLSRKGWDVAVVSRSQTVLPEECRHIAADARDAERLKGVIGSDTDLVLSCVAFDAGDAQCLASAGAAAGRIVVISSASVYCDAQGRTLDEAHECGFPAFPVPLTEESQTVPPGPQTYSTRKVAMEQTLLAEAACPVTILRPCAVHGPDSKHAREWWFVKRLLDGRAAIPLAYQGRSRFQTTSVTAIADAVVRAVAGKLPVVANVSDADSPTVAEIGRAIMDIMGVRADLVGLPDPAVYPPEHGVTPWSVAGPMVCAAAATSPATYAQAVEPAIAWLAGTVPSEHWKERLPQLAAYPVDLFDYAADERALQVSGAARLVA